jgi:hypothetical protein
MPMKVEIAAPTAAELSAPSFGIDLTIRGTVSYPLVVSKVEVSFDNVPALVQLDRQSNKNEWTASGKVQKSGSLTIRAKAYDTTNLVSPVAALTVVVPPTQWQPITVEVNDPPVPAAGARIEVGPAGKLLAVWVHTTYLRKSVEVQTSIDNYTSTVPLFVKGELLPWYGEVMLPGADVPNDRVLLVREFDSFNQVNETDFHFATLDVTPPTITIAEPSEDQVLVMPSASFPVTVTFRGSVNDTQSHYKNGTLKYSFAGQHDIPVTPDGGGAFVFDIQVAGYGPHTLAIVAEDNSGNKTTPIVRQFELVSSYKPKSIEDLLAPRSYLDALLRFIRSHILDGDGKEIDTEVLHTNLLLDFGKISEPGSQVGSRIVNDLLPAVALLRNSARPNAGLLFRFTFDKPEGRPPLEFPDEGPHRRGTGILKPDPLPAKPGVKFSDPKTNIGAVEFDGTHYALFGHRAGLNVGDNDQDFSLSFWIYVNDAGIPNGQWRGVLYKGHEDPSFTNVNRTFGVWLYPDRNTVHYRISTTTNHNAGGDSNTPIPVAQWTHVAYVRRGNHLRLFLNGAVDSEATLTGIVLPNTDGMMIGKSPYHGGIDGALDDLRIYGMALTPDDVAALAQSRNSPALSETPVGTYVVAAYEALLLGAGTSYEEIRSLPPKQSADRLRIAQRLGLLAPSGTDDYLDLLLPPTGFLGVQMEGWLSATFDLPLSASKNDLLVAQSWSGWLLQTRQDNLTRIWMQEDSTVAAADRQPYLEPDLVDPEDLAQSHKTAAAKLSSRTAELAAKWELLRAAATANSALIQVFSNQEVQSLDTIESDDSAGLPIEASLEALSLSFVAFRRVRRYQSLNAPMSEREKEDLAHLLIGVWKLRDRYPVWRSDECAMPDPLWPTSNTEGAFVSGHYKHNFLPWRGTVSERTAIEQRIAARLSDWRTLSESIERAVLDAQRIALPQLRDRLLGLDDLPSAADYQDELTERLLVDMGASGATTLTLIDQATLTLQNLVNGIRTKRFESGHPAFGWRLKTDWTPDPPMDDSSWTNFDEEWTWLGSYGTWRSAMMVYLHPENALYPDLRPNRSGAYSTFLDELRTLALTSEAVAKLSKKYSAASPPAAKLVGDELSFFMPVSIALALEKAGLFTLALDWYRKVFDPSQQEGTRALATKLRKERNVPRAPKFEDRWCLNLNPHTIADQMKATSGRKTVSMGNPYTRFTLGRIVSCMIALGDGEFARGTLDSREKALSIYLEAKQILGFNDLDDLVPTNPGQAYLPNQVFSALRMHAAASLRKIRLGLSYTGAPMLADPTRESGGAQVSPLLRPTPYPFKVLLERSRQLLAQAQNLEAQYLAALVQRDAEEEKFRREAANAQIADETLSVRLLQEVEANDGLGLANLQKARTQIQRDRYQQWISAGPNQNERTQVDMLWQLKSAQDHIAAIDAWAAANAASEGVGLVFWNWAMAGVATGLALARAAAQGFANNFGTQAQVSGILASQERRQDEWQLQVDLANKDLDIGDQQIRLANDRKAIAARESRIAGIQRDQAMAMLTFLRTKFTSREFYDWLQGVLAEIYGRFLYMATATAQQAERQLAFQRQQTFASIIKQNYWDAASDWNNAYSVQSTTDRRGITGSARLLQDISTLDQYAFDTEKRLLNLNQTFSLSTLFPIEFEEFRNTGLLSFATTLRMFDEGFPGHFMRLIKKVRASVIALIPPGQGIRATLSTGGLSRVVTGDPNFPVVVVRQDPQAVALSSPSASTGVFDLDTQSDVLYPFEGMGADANWSFELPRAGNPFDFDTLFDVLVTFEYTALNSSELRERTVKQLPRRMISDRSWSVRRNLPDVWYDLANQTSASVKVLLPLSKSDFPSYLGVNSIEEVLISVRMVEGNTGDFSVSPSFIKRSGEVISALAAPAVQGVASSRQSGAANWRTALLSDANRGEASLSTWSFELVDTPDGLFSLGQALRDGRVDDILIVMTFGGSNPDWPA